MGINSAGEWNLYIWFAGMDEKNQKEWHVGYYFGKGSHSNKEKCMTYEK